MKKIFTVIFAVILLVSILPFAGWFINQPIDYKKFEEFFAEYDSKEMCEEKTRLRCEMVMKNCAAPSKNSGFTFDEVCRGKGKYIAWKAKLDSFTIFQLRLKSILVRGNQK